jgi:hypothetical protein
MVTTRSNNNNNDAPSDPDRALPPVERERGTPLAPQGGLSLNQQKKLFRAIEDAGGLYTVDSAAKQVLDSDPGFFGPNSVLRRQFRNRINVVKNPTDPDPEAYYCFLKELGIQPNVTGVVRSTKGLPKGDHDSELKASRSPSVLSPDPPFPSKPWSSPQRLQLVPRQPTPPLYQHRSTSQHRSTELMSKDLVTRFAQIDLVSARFDFEKDDSVDGDTKQRIRCKRWDRGECMIVSQALTAMPHLV